MKQDAPHDVPMLQQISFKKLIERYEDQYKNGDSIASARAGQILEAVKPYPELRDGFQDLAVLDERKEAIGILLSEIFAPVLAQNEIKTASVPFSKHIFQSTQRFKNILNNAGDGFELQIRNMPDTLNYILQCTIILKFYYNIDMDVKRPLYYDIPDSKGVMRHYRILYNADFMDITPTDKARNLNEKDFEVLLDNYGDVEVWKEMFPPNSFVSSGFLISNLFDVTTEYSVSEIKSNLIGNEFDEDGQMSVSFENTFKSLFNLKNISVGFSSYCTDTKRFEQVPGSHIQSYLLGSEPSRSCNESLCAHSYSKLIVDNEVMAISNIGKYHKKDKSAQPFKTLYENGFKSAILSPIADNGELLGVVEVVSTKVNELNSMNATRLDDVMPFIIAAVKRSKVEEQNMIDAIIQHECTTVHESVYWRFQDEAHRFMVERAQGGQPQFEEVVFKDVYPLFGQIDIKDSSKERNLAIQRDLIIQMTTIQDILKKAYDQFGLPAYEELMFRVGSHLEEIRDVLYTNSEQAIFDFIQDDVQPAFHHLKRENSEMRTLVETYENMIDAETQSYYDHRRNYDSSVTEINMELAALLDRRQEEAQEMFPHYFERYKTDGIEHNMYIGASITRKKEFDSLYLANLRLWQLQVMVEMENKHYSLKKKLPLPLDVASLLLVYSTPMAIRFRLDEKQFDVDGTYNARYEIIKKRIDKSLVKGTKERLTQKGKLAIVYSQKKDEKEYLRYVNFLKSKGYFTNNIEVLELEGLQGVTGLKAIRAEILYKADEKSEKTYTYDDLMEALNV